MKNKPTYPVGLPPEFIAAHKAKKEAQAAKAAGAALIVQSDAGKKKKKKKSKSKSTNTDKLTEEMEKTRISEPEVGKQLTNTTESAKINKSENSEDAEKSEQTVDPAKRLKNLKKKLREIETLELKIKGGEIKHPIKEMLEKVSKKASIRKEIEKLEASQ